MKQATVIDLFSGVGGLSLGAARAGFTLALAVEHDNHALAAHKRNFPNVTHSDADIRRLTGDKMLQAAGLQVGELDGLVGGPPCQGFSIIGHRRTADSRNNLFRKFFSLVAESRPKFFVAENVLGVLDRQYKRIRDAALDLVRGEYALLEPLRFKASDFGAPTVRERVFFIGWLKDLNWQLSGSDFDACKVKSQTTVSKALRGLPRIRSTWLTAEQGWRLLSGEMPKSDFSERVKNGIPQNVGDTDAIRRLKDEGAISGCLGTVHTPKVAARYADLKPGEQDEISKSIRLKPDGLCPTLRAGTDATRGSYQAVRPIHPTSPRVITPREAARLQGFPDWFQFAPSKWHSFRQIGNSVSPFVSEAVLRVIYSRIIQGYGNIKKTNT